METQTMIPTAKAADELPPRGNAKFDSTNRGAVRKWLTNECGATWAEIKDWPLAKLAEAYNDETDATVRRYLAEERGAAETTAPTVEAAPQTAKTAADSKAEQLEKLIRELAANDGPAPLDEARVLELIAEHAPAAATPREIIIRLAERAPVKMSRQHYKFEMLLAFVAARVPAFLVGPAGSGKTTAAEKVAEALELAWGAISVGPMTSKADLFGMVDANGVYHESLLVKIAREGGVFLFDELDAGHPGVLTAINMLLANGAFATPAGMVEKHPDFVALFGLNTFGTGSDRQYVGRNQLDAATLDRGAFIDWDLDEGLESALLGFDYPSPAFDLAEGGVPTVAEWLETVRRARRAAATAGLRHVISPRASLYGASLIAAGIGRTHLTQTLLVKGLDDAAKAKLLNN